MNSENRLNEKQNSSSSPEKSKAGGAIWYLLVSVFIFLTAGLGIFSLIVSDKSFSDSENRVLAQKPELKMSKLIDGSFMSDFESWLADQFPLRDKAISLKTEFDRIMGKREQNGVYIGDDGFLFDTQTVPDEEETAEKLELINAFLQKHEDAQQMFMLIPNSSFIYSEHLPYSLKVSDQKAQIEAVYDKLISESLIKCDTVSVLSKAKEKGTLLYYRTDHHWTTAAAYEIFRQLEKGWGFDRSGVNYDFYTVTDDFEGTLSSKAGVHDNRDIIEICLPENSEGSYIVNFESEQRKEATLFSKEKLNEKNKYEVFLGGNYDKVSIKTTAANDRVLLLIKDSYANCMIPMLTPHFSQIVIVDPRYMTEGIDTVMEEYSFTHILFLYNVNTFFEDSTLTTTLNQ